MKNPGIRRGISYRVKLASKLSRKSLCCNPTNDMIVVLRYQGWISQNHARPFWMFYSRRAHGASPSFPTLSLTCFKILPKSNRSSCNTSKRFSSPNIANTRSSRIEKLGRLAPNSPAFCWPANRDRNSPRFRTSFQRGPNCRISNKKWIWR